MGRYARRTLVNIPYHVLNRENNHQQIFYNEEDFSFFLETLRKFEPQLTLYRYKREEN